MSEKMTTANSAEQGKVDIDFAECAVPKWSRRRFVTMFMIMLGFTFFSASMWVGQEMAAGLDFWGFIKALLLGGAILGIYTGLLGYVGAETGLSLDLLSRKRFLYFFCADKFYTDRMVWRRYCNVCNSGST